MKHIITFHITLKFIILILFFIGHLECVNIWVSFCSILKEKFNWVRIKPVLRKNRKGMYYLKKTFNYTKLQHFKKLILRNRLHQKTLTHLVHQKDQKLQMSQVEN